MRKILERFRLWRRRRLYRKVSRLMRPYLNPPDRQWFSLNVEVSDAEEKGDG